MARKKTAAELRAENRFLRQHAIGENVTKILLSLITTGGYAFIAFMVFLSIDSLSGKNTNAKIDIQAKGEISIPQSGTSAPQSGTLSNDIVSMLTTSAAPVTLAVIFGFLGLNYGRKQAKLRKDTVERLQTRIQAFEAKLDADRTSSKLTPRGDTNPEDET